MAIQVECPACEHQFSVPERHAGKKGKCPACGNLFDTARHSAPLEPLASESGTKAGAVGTLAPPEIPLPREVAARVVSRPPPVETVKEPPQNEFPSFGKSTTSSAGAPNYDDTYSIRSRRGMFPLIVTLTSLCVVLVTCIALLIVLDPFGSGEAATNIDPDSNRENPPPAINKISDSDKKTRERNPASTGVADASAERTVKDVEPKEKADDISTDTLDKHWKNVFPMLCKIESTGPGGKKTGSGFIVDRRGWVATAMHLVQGAESVEVRLPNMTDEVLAPPVDAMGMIATNPDLDLAIIKVDTSDAFGLLTARMDAAQILSPDDALMGAGYLSEGAPWLGPCKIEKIIAASELSSETQEVLAERGVDEEHKFEWIQHNSALKDGCTGGPLLDARGTVIGMNIQLAVGEKKGYALPIHHLAALTLGATDDFKPFGKSIATTESVAKPLEPPPMPEKGEPDPPAPGTFESEEWIKKLHKAAKEFAWTPKSAEQYRTLQDLALYVTAALSAEEDGMVDKTVAEFLTVTAREVLNDLNETPWPEDGILETPGNLATEGLETKGTPIFAYIEVVTAYRLVEKVNGLDAVIAKLVGTDTRIVVPVKEKESLRELQRKTRWLLVGRHDKATNVSRQGYPIINAKFLVMKPELVDPSAM